MTRILCKFSQRTPRQYFTSASQARPHLKPCILLSLTWIEFESINDWSSGLRVTALNHGSCRMERLGDFRWLIWKSSPRCFPHKTCFSPARYWLFACFQKAASIFCTKINYSGKERTFINSNDMRNAKHELWIIKPLTWLAHNYEQIYHAQEFSSS